MSRANIRDSLEGKLKTIAPALSTAWEHKKFTPVTGVPYQRANILYADTNNPSAGINMHREKGVFQITLAYPMGKGSKNIEARADLVRAAFKRGLTVTKNGVNTVVESPPSIETLPDEKDRAVVIVKINFFTEIFF